MILAVLRGLGTSECRISKLRWSSPKALLLFFLKCVHLTFHHVSLSHNDQKREDSWCKMAELPVFSIHYPSFKNGFSNSINEVSDADIRDSHFDLDILWYTMTRFARILQVLGWEGAAKFWITLYRALSPPHFLFSSSDAKRFCRFLKLCRLLKIQLYSKTVDKTL